MSETKNWSYAIHELQFVDGDVKKTVAPGTTLSLGKDIYDDFIGLNAIRDATKEEIAAAKGGDGTGVTSVKVEDETAAAEAAAEAAKVEAEKQAKLDAAKAESERVAAESDRNREEAKVAAAAKAATGKPAADKAADKTTDPLA